MEEGWAEGHDQEMAGEEPLARGGRALALNPSWFLKGGERRRGRGREGSKRTEEGRNEAVTTEDTLEPRPAPNPGPVLIRPNPS